MSIENSPVGSRLTGCRGVYRRHEMLKKSLFISILSLTIIIPGFSQDTDKKAVEKVGDKVYFETILEDFESTSYSKKDNLRYRVTRYQKADCRVRDAYAAPTGKSKKYLGVKFFARSGDVLKIVPAKKLVIDKYCRSIAVWVYGKRFSGTLYIVLQDSTKQNHVISLGSTDFLGWRKLIVRLTKRVNQEDEFLNQKRFIQILALQYRPTKVPRTMTRRPRWHYFYLDDISAMVRDKYTDRQSDDW